MDKFRSPSLKSSPLRKDISSESVFAVALMRSGIAAMMCSAKVRTLLSASLFKGRLRSQLLQLSRRLDKVLPSVQTEQTSQK